MSIPLRSSLCILLAPFLLLATPHLSRSIDFSLCGRSTDFSLYARSTDFSLYASVANEAIGHRLKSMLRRATGQQSSRDVSGVPARQSRDWVRDGVVYEIFPRAFSQEGNFNGITAQLDRLKDLGVTILWLMPIHQIGQEKRKGSVGSPYAVRDFYSINPDYGTKEDLRRLVTETHRRRMKLIIDIVANHTSWDSVMMKEPAY